jgi:threonine aldolase
MLGGAMRQAGILAAAALYALDNNIERLADDHRNAKRLAEGLEEIEGVRVLEKPVETNLVFFSVAGAGKNSLEVMHACREAGLLLNPEDYTVMRAVTHLDVSAENIDRAVNIFKKVIGK